MDKLAAYEVALVDHPLWEMGAEKTALHPASSWAAVGGVGGTLAGAGLGYSKNRGGTRRERMRGAALGGAIGGSLGLTAGGAADIRNHYRHAAATLEADHARQALRDITRHTEALREMDRNSADLDRVSGKVDKLWTDIKSLEDLDRYMTE